MHRKRVRISLGLKLMLVNIFVIFFGMLVVWLAMDILASDFTTQLMTEFNVLPARIHWLFLSAVHRYLMWSALAAIGMAAVLSFLMTRHVLAPLRAIKEVAEKIASGDYSKRAAVTSHDEIAMLAIDLNIMTENLERIESLRKKMVTDVAHELRTPLTNMRGYIEGIIDEVIPPSPENLKLLEDESLRLAKLVENLLQLAEADAAAMTCATVNIDLRDILENANRMLSTRTEKKNLKIDLRMAEDATRIHADPDKLTQVLLNLLENAMRYSLPNTDITVCATRASNQVRVAISNTTDTMDEGQIELIFERFYRGEPSRSREHGGAGIGLSIVRELIAVQGGQTGAEKTEKGITVWFTVPTEKN